ncbi:MAG: hypothetical protein WBD47_04635, partial [Phormidesmis sp.]
CLWRLPGVVCGWSYDVSVVVVINPHRASATPPILLFPSLIANHSGISHRRSAAFLSAQNR